MICTINKNINEYIKQFDWSKRLSDLINKEVEINTNEIDLFEIETNVYGLEIVIGYEVFCIPLKCLSYYCEEFELNE